MQIAQAVAHEPVLARITDVVLQLQIVGSQQRGLILEALKSDPSASEELVSVWRGSNRQLDLFPWLLERRARDMAIAQRPQTGGQKQETIEDVETKNFADAVEAVQRVCEDMKSAGEAIRRLPIPASQEELAVRRRLINPLETGLADLLDHVFPDRLESS